VSWRWWVVDAGVTEWTKLYGPQRVRTVNDRRRLIWLRREDRAVTVVAPVDGPQVVVAASPGAAIAQATLRAVIEKQRKRQRYRRRLHSRERIAGTAIARAELGRQ
jgi:hypothetical protein